MNKLVTIIIASSFLLGGCTYSNKQVPRTMPVNEYKGQGFQPKAEKDAIALAKKHKKEFANLGERFFKDNFGLNVKATNVVGNEDGVEVFVHCDDHDIVFNSSILLTKNALGHKGTMRASEESDELSTQIGNVVSGFDYKANKKEYDELYRYFKDNQKKYGYYGYTKEAINKTQNSGYQNEFFRLSSSGTTLKEYKTIYQPLISLNNSDFKTKYQRLVLSYSHRRKPELITNLFDVNQNFEKEKDTQKVINMSNDIKSRHVGPPKSQLEFTLEFLENTIITSNAKTNNNPSMRYGVYYDE